MEDFMSDSIVTGLFTLCVALISGFAGFQLHKNQRKEKFKELIYNKKFVLYEDMSRILSDMIIGAVIYDSSDKDQSLTLEELSTFQAKIGVLLMNNELIISNDVKSACWAITQPFATAIKEHTSLKPVIDQATNAINKMREELGIDALEKDITDSIAFSSKLMSQWKPKIMPTPPTRDH